MFSKEEEYVDFADDFTCNGAVENYLNDLKDKMQITLAHKLNEAKKSADNWAFADPRETWLDKPCA